MSTKSTNANVNSNAVEFPTAPYPGLRPFLEHEALLFHGRKLQVREVIRRLRSTQFIAVIGGSGSGKSSLVRAGVVPELRSFGIPGAGDFWIPMTFTPGTNATTVQTGKSGTPITRLAWKFSQLLEKLENDTEEEKRRDDIAALFRQNAGFTRLIEVYGENFKKFDGPLIENARILFVIDQFEELFHPTNRFEPDTARLVENVIDHFFNPHPRCFIVLTMRSEHLNDCAGFLDLPDAINKSFYLVRRLDREELHKAIIGPAQSYLRILYRLDLPNSPPLPEQVKFESAVIERLLSDVDSIVHDPDHLPLLQHLLARLWQTACERESVGNGVPASITWQDLQCAVLVTQSNLTKCADTIMLAQLESATNILRESLQRWADAVYMAHTIQEREMIDSIFKKLAFKDPNNGLYLQQRLNVDDPSLIEGVTEPREILRNLVAYGFLNSVNYLFWDDENPSRVALKVSHESFIRGWEHFRRLIDNEAERFEEFVTVLRRCALWEASKDPELLLEGSELLRVEAMKLWQVFGNANQRGEWFRFLLHHRDGNRLAKVESSVDAFLLASRARDEADAEAKRGAARAEAKVRRNKKLAVAAIIAAFTLLPYAIFAIYVQRPVMNSIDKFATARRLVEDSDRVKANAARSAASEQLNVLLQAANLVETAKSDVAFLDSHFMTHVINWMKPIGDARYLASKLTSEPMVNGRLRSVLTTALWRSHTDPSSLNNTLVFSPTRKEIDCNVAVPNGTSKSFKGSLLLDSSTQRGLFFPQTGERNDEISLYGAIYNNGACNGTIGWSVPRYLNPLLLFDARLNYMAVALSGTAGGDPSVSLYSLQWTQGSNEQNAAVQVQFRSVVGDKNAVDILSSEFKFEGNTEKVSEIKSVKSWFELGGIGVSVAKRSWRLFSEGGQKIIFPGTENSWTILKSPPAGSGCEKLGKALSEKIQPGFKSKMLQEGNQCFEIKGGNPSLAHQGQTSRATISLEPLGKSPRHEVLVAVYDEPRVGVDLDLRETLPPSIASLAAFGQFTDETGEWVIGKTDNYEGWIALRQKTTDNTITYVGAPWSTRALMRLGKEVYDASKLP